jgi:hypothetical protein
MQRPGRGGIRAQHTYALEERQQADADAERVRKYIETHHGKPNRK